MTNRISVDTTDTGKRLTEAQCRAIFEEFGDAAVIVNKYGFLPGQTVHIIKQSVADLLPRHDDSSLRRYQ